MKLYIYSHGNTLRTVQHFSKPADLFAEVEVQRKIYNDGYRQAGDRAMSGGLLSSFTLANKYYAKMIEREAYLKRHHTKFYEYQENDGSFPIPMDKDKLVDLAKLTGYI